VVTDLHLNLEILDAKVGARLVMSMWLIKEKFLEGALLELVV